MSDVTTTTAVSKGTDKGPGELIGEVRTLVTDYAKQETVEPLKRLAKWLAFGLAGALLIALGLFLLLLGGLRLLQTETNGTFDGNWSFAPYLIAFGGTAVFVALAVWGIVRSPGASDHGEDS